MPTPPEFSSDPSGLPSHSMPKAPFIISESDFSHSTLVEAVLEPSEDDPWVVSNLIHAVYTTLHFVDWPDILSLEKSTRSPKLPIMWGLQAFPTTQVLVLSTCFMLLGPS